MSYTVDGREVFFSDGKTQDAVIRNIEIVGQAVKGISDGTRALEPAVPWRQIAGMRDKLIHEYFGVDLVLVWDVVERELPTLRVTPESELEVEVRISETQVAVAVAAENPFNGDSLFQAARDVIESRAHTPPPPLQCQICLSQADLACLKSTTTLVSTTAREGGTGQSQRGDSSRWVRPAFKAGSFEQQQMMPTRSDAMFARAPSTG